MTSSTTLVFGNSTATVTLALKGLGQGGKSANTRGGALTRESSMRLGAAMMKPARYSNTVSPPKFGGAGACATTHAPPVCNPCVGIHAAHFADDTRTIESAKTCWPVADSTQTLRSPR